MCSRFSLFDRVSLWAPNSSLGLKTYEVAAGLGVRGFESDINGKVAPFPSHILRCVEDHVDVYLVEGIDIRAIADIEKACSAAARKVE